MMERAIYDFIQGLFKHHLLPILIFIIFIYPYTPPNFNETFVCLISINSMTQGYLKLYTQYENFILKHKNKTKDNICLYNLKCKVDKVCILSIYSQCFYPFCMIAGNSATIYICSMCHKQPKYFCSTYYNKSSELTTTLIN